MNPAKGFSLYLQTELGIGSAYYYSYPFGVSSTLFLKPSDSTVGTKLSFELGFLNPFVNFGVNIPTGDQLFSGISRGLPSEFVDTPYQGVTFGVSALAGVEIPDPSGEFTLQAGYMDPGVFNQTFDLPQDNINNSVYSDTFLLSANRSQTLGNGGKQDFGLWFLAYDPARPAFTQPFQLGPSFNFYYRLKNPQGFSLDSGIQLFLRSQSSPLSISGSVPYTYYTYGPMAPEPHNSRGPRLYLNPSIAVKQVTFDFQVNHIFPNDYPVGDTNHNEGGWLLGFGPIWSIPSGNKSTFKLSAAYQKIIEQNWGFDINGNRTDLLYDVFQFGIKYEVGF